MLSGKDKATRYTTGAILLIVALNAFGGGWYGMAGAEAVPVEWLEGTPFKNYFIPALVLFTVVGGSSLVAAILNFTGRSFNRRASFMAGGTMLIWIAVQVAMIGYVSWLQPAIAIAGVLVIVLTAFRGSLKPKTTSASTDTSAQ
ncbi:MAG: hypothetical protein KDC07_04130 [Chitinophagaceae bacterium]|nr:hypothetical protein [Chitinophagaceae bacterium]MCB9047149.1 hypothetical protein [Chitinophagales bacterium]